MANLASRISLLEGRSFANLHVTFSGAQINQELLALVGGLIPTEEEDNQKLAFVGRLKTLFEKEWPGTGPSCDPLTTGRLQICCNCYAHIRFYGVLWARSSASVGCRCMKTP